MVVEVELMLDKTTVHFNGTYVHVAESPHEVAVLVGDAMRTMAEMNRKGPYR
jgi:hypothetical protein